jgi:hypothetical protein
MQPSELENGACQRTSLEQGIRGSSREVGCRGEAQVRFSLESSHQQEYDGKPEQGSRFFQRPESQGIPVLAFLASELICLASWHSQASCIIMFSAGLGRNTLALGQEFMTAIFERNPLQLRSIRL